MEENTEIQKPQEEKKKRGGILPWLLLIVSLIGNGVLVYMFNREKEIVIQKEEIIKTVYVERDNVKTDLVTLKTDFDNLHTNNKKLQSAIDKNKIQLDSLIELAEKNKNNKYIIAKLRKETNTLRQIMIGYVHTIDSLNTINKKLIIEKNDAVKKLDEEKNKSSQLNKDKESLQSAINNASVLSCYGITAQGIDIKKGGKKQSVTTKAKKTDVIRVSYSLGENKISKPGSKDVYVRIMTPDGKELAKNYDDNYKFKFNGSTGYYAGKTTLDYANKEIGVTTSCEGDGAFIPGKYIIEITCDGVVVGQSSITLN